MILQKVSQQGECPAKKNPAALQGQGPLEEPGAPKGEQLPPPDTTYPADKIFTCSQAAKRLGIPLSTLRRLVRDGTLWTVRMKNGEVGLKESEVQWFIDRV